MEHKIVFSHFIYIHALMGYTTAKLLHVHIQCSTMLFKVPFISNVIIERKMAICVRVVHVLMINEHISWNTATCISFMSTYVCTPRCHISLIWHHSCGKVILSMKKASSMHGILLCLDRGETRGLVLTLK